jgi:hypothetical protein
VLRSCKQEYTGQAIVNAENPWVLAILVPKQNY